jgi:type VI secretion system protein ImpK
MNHVELASEYPRVLLFFKAFYEELMRLRTVVVRQKSQMLKRVGEKSSPAFSQKEHVIDVSDTLVNFLENQALEARKLGGSMGESVYREAQYVMAALADEVFLSLPAWEGRMFWQQYLLEQRLFRTHVAGAKFFDAAEDLLKTNDPLRLGLGFIYLTALGVGFRGKYRGVNDQGVLDDYKERLFMYVYREKPRLLDNEGELLFPEAVSATITRPLSRPLLGEVRRWSLVLAAALGIYAVLAYGVWFGVTHQLQTSADMILEDLASATDDV